jgi:hypothetical protein
VRKPLDLGTESFTLAPFPTKPQRAAAFRAIAPLNQKKGSEGQNDFQNENQF